MNRRQFLIASGAAAATAGIAGGVSWGELMHNARSRPQPTGTPVLVVLTMYGGNDGLNTLVPYADPAYHSARPELAYPESAVVRLDDSFGLNPSMSGFGKLWQDGTLAVVRGVGYPQPDHSHFRSMDIWQTGSPGAGQHRVDRPVAGRDRGRSAARGEHRRGAATVGDGQQRVRRRVAVGQARHRAGAVDHRAGRPGPARRLGHGQPGAGTGSYRAEQQVGRHVRSSARSERVR